MWHSELLVRLQEGRRDMGQAISFASDVNDILSRFIAIHDDISKFSFRKLIPIPGIFKAIDYCIHETNLGDLAAKLGHVRQQMALEMVHSTVPSEAEFLAALEDYSSALLDTIEQLLLISASLCRKAEGARDYPMERYNKEMSHYNLLVEKYRSLGRRLNSLLQRCDNNA